MALLGKAAVAMWWDIAPQWRAEFEDWHSHEHFPERMGIPGFLRGSRWSDARGGEGFFVMYELDRYDTLTSSGYMERLNHPTPWSTKLMPHHRNMVRSQCHVLHSQGGALARHVLTVRCSPQPGRADALQAYLAAQAEALVVRAGTTGAHLLQTQTPAAAPTTEQKIRGGDRVADWIFIVSGYALEALEAVAGDALSAAALQAHGAQAQGQATGLYALSHTLESSSLAVGHAAQ